MESRAARDILYMNYYIYFLTNKTNAVLYIGVTNDLRRRLLEHKNEVVEGFTKRYHVHKLIYYELYKHPQDAIVREKQLKKWTREKKNNLVASYNPQWEEITDIR